MKPSSFQENDICVITYNDSIDWEFVQNNEVVKKSCIDKSKLIILDMQYVSFVDSMGIGALVKTYKEIIALDKKCCLVGLKTALRKVFAISEIDNLIPIFKTQIEARSYFLY